MADFAKLALTAQRLIAANGRLVTLVKYGSDSQDQDKPWRGRSEYHEAEVIGYAAFVPGSLTRATVAENEDGVLREKDYALFAAEDDQGYELESFDAIEDDGVLWKIVSCELINPASKRVLYQFEVKR